MVLQWMNSMGFVNTYDFFYLPIDYKTRCNIGYAFINFINASKAEAFTQAFEGLMLSQGSSKACKVSPARAQGLAANIEAYRNSPVMGIGVQAYEPLLFRNGEVVKFPAPDAPLPPVQLREPLPMVCGAHASPDDHQSRVQ